MDKPSSELSFPYPDSSDNLQNDFNLLMDFDFDIDLDISNLPRITDFNVSDVFDDLDDAALGFEFSDLIANSLSSHSSSSSIADGYVFRSETLALPQSKPVDSSDEGIRQINNEYPSKDAQSCSSSDSLQQNDPEVDKRQRRMLRNRELAHESRQRKKSYISDLEAKCKRLEQERDVLQKQVYYSCAENAVLKEELSRIKKMKGYTGMAEPAVLLKNSLPLEFLSFLICLCLLLEQLPQCVRLFLPFDKVRTGDLEKKLMSSSSPRLHYHFGIHSPIIAIPIKDPG